MAREFQESKVKKRSKVFKVLKWTGITFLLLLIVLISLPFIFKDKLVEVVKQEVNNSVNAQVDWGDFDLTLISSFPDFSFNIQDVNVTGVNEFEGQTLANIKNTSIKLDLMSVISGGKIKVKNIQIDEPTIHVIINEDTVANYDIAKTTEEIEADTAISDAEPLEYDLGLQNFTITDAHITYDDVISNIHSEVKNMDFELTGDFNQDVLDTKTIASIESLTVSEGPVTYMNQTNVALDADVNIDQFTTYTLKENTLRLNELEVGFDGFLTMLEESMNMDLTFNSKKTDFKSILSLVPAVYLADFSTVTTKGKFALDGMMKGELKGEEYPAFDINLGITDGYFKYPDLPNDAKNINITTNVSHPQGDLDKMKIDVSKFHLELAENPIDGNLKISTPMSDPNLSSKIMAKIDLGSLSSVVPMEENEKLNGNLEADLELGGKLSSITNEQYQDFKAEGDLLVSEMLYTSKALPYKVNVNTMEMAFSPQYVELKNLDTQIGKSDIKADGRIDNILQHVFNNEVLKGSMNVNSTMLDLDDLSRSAETEEAETGGTSDTSAYEALRIPANYDLALNTDIKELIYDGLSIKNVKGGVKVKDEEAILDKVNLDMLGGNVKMSGSYNSKPINPKVDFSYNIDELNIEQTTSYFTSIETIAPILKKCKGLLSSNLTFSSELDNNMSPIYSSLNGKGGLISNNLKVEGVKVLEKIADVLKVKDIASQSLKNVKLAFKFEDGRATVNPFDLKLSGIPTNISGSTGFDQSIDYDIKMKVPSAKLGGKANEVMESLLGKVKIPGQTISVPKVIPVNFTVGGSVTNPKLQTDLKNNTTNMVTDLKDKVVDTVKQTFNAEIDKIMADARKRGEQLRTEAKIQADKLRAEGTKATATAKAKADEIAEQAKTKADEEAAKLASKGGNPFEKIANQKLAEAGKKRAYAAIEKTKQEAYKRAEIPEKQAEDKAQKLENEAGKQANKLLETAQQRADALKR